MPGEPEDTEGERQGMSPGGVLARLPESGRRHLSSQTSGVIPNGLEQVPYVKALLPLSCIYSLSFTKQRSSGPVRRMRLPPWGFEWEET